MRPIFEGTIGKIFGFRVMPDFAGGTTTLQDAYVEANLYPSFKLRVGKFKPPVGLERLQSATEIKWVERGLTTNLVPNRDVGVQVSGDVLDGTFNYTLGWFNGVADVADVASGDPNAGDAKEWAARLVAQPFLNDTGVLQNLTLALSATYGEKEGAADLGRYRTQAQQVFLGYRNAAGSTAIADGNARRISSQVTWTWRSFGLLADYLRSQAEVALGAAHQNLSHEAWQVATSWVITGEEENVRGVNPAQPFALGADRGGAIELLARLGELAVAHNAFPVYANPASAACKAKAWGVV